jgi:hypothetical protein
MERKEGMEEKIICLSWGLSRQDIEKGTESFGRMHPEMPRPEVTAVAGAILEMPVGEVLGEVLTGQGLEKDEDASAVETDLPCLAGSYKTVIVYAREREQVFAVMRSFKAVLPDAQDMIFAVVTPTALEWTFRDYIMHLACEHDQMKAGRPENNRETKKS